MSASAALVLTPGVASWRASTDARAHAHHAVQLVLGSDFALVGDHVRVAGGLAGVSANRPHALRVDGVATVLLVDGELLLGRHLGALLESGPAEEALERLVAGLDRRDPTSAAVLLDRLRAGVPRPPPRSAAVRAALAHVDEQLGAIPRLDDVAAAAGVAPSTLTHRFSAEVGLPFRRFLVWRRVQHAVDAVAEGASLTEAAVAAGFSDGAHLSRTFRRFFGVTPSQALRAAKGSLGRPS